ncbi:hypothetical protein OUZ56_032123 [Daphnia magna]|uniref:Uncharacterized protein n=1 Tax=Daphnia magna TaxID=35525 RepID=A0ABQ9ZW97_9CRUS|nr:hypothetical protein OUZ56_032123 [Daphnia magna]
MDQNKTLNRVLITSFGVPVLHVLVVVLTNGIRTGTNEFISNQKKAGKTPAEHKDHDGREHKV